MIYSTKISKFEEYRKQLFDSYVSKVPENSKDYALSILNKLYSKIYEEKLIRYTEIFGMNQDDALEMFVRFNSGGKALKKSEITMSILEAYWSQAKQEFGKVLVSDFSGFDSDFIIRTALMLYGDVIKSTINRNLATQLKDNWNSFKKALKNLSVFLKGLNINISRFSNSWNVLLPIIYVIYFNPDTYQNYTNELRAYLIRAIFFGYFNAGTTAKLQQMKSDINSFKRVNMLRIWFSYGAAISTRKFFLVNAKYNISTTIVSVFPIRRPHLYTFLVCLSLSIST